MLVGGAGNQVFYLHFAFTFSATKQYLNLKPQGAANLLGSMEVLLDGALICDVVCWSD